MARAPTVPLCCRFSLVLLLEVDLIVLQTSRLLLNLLLKATHQCSSVLTQQLVELWRKQEAKRMIEKSDEKQV